MPTKREREYYAMGFRDGRKFEEMGYEATGRMSLPKSELGPKPKRRKLSAWNKFVKANAKKPRFRLRSGAPNLKKLGVAFRKTPAGRKKRR
jgi:hypothetical protein